MESVPRGSCPRCGRRWPHPCTARPTAAEPRTKQPGGREEAAAAAAAAVAAGATTTTTTADPQAGAIITATVTGTSPVITAVGTAIVAAAHSVNPP